MLPPGTPGSTSGQTHCGKGLGWRLAGEGCTLREGVPGQLAGRPYPRIEGPVDGGGAVLRRARLAHEEERRFRRREQLARPVVAGQDDAVAAARVRVVRPGHEALGGRV